MMKIIAKIVARGFKKSKAKNRTIVVVKYPDNISKFFIIETIQIFVVRKLLENLLIFSFNSDSYDLDSIFEQALLNKYAPTLADVISVFHLVNVLSIFAKMKKIANEVIVINCSCLKELNDKFKILTIKGNISSIDLLSTKIL